MSGIDNSPAAKVVVSLTGDRTKVKQVSATTDDAGFYSITLNEELLDDKEQELLLQVSDPGKKKKYGYQKKVVAKKGQIDFENILLVEREIKAPKEKHR